ncbi:fungal hydrophobin [Fomes fomentarius]|nr:fungal hydrophobin [Fomes fomentarius]
MFSYTLALAITAMPLLAAANPIEARYTKTCSTGRVQCCDTTATAGSGKGSSVLGLLGIVLDDTNIVLGLQCTPISIIGAGLGGSCANQAVCCQDNSHGSLVSIGCIPVQL